MKRLVGRAVALVILFGGSAVSPASAHHSFAPYESTKPPITLTGTLERADLANPHSHLYLLVPKAGAAPQRWVLETQALAGLRRAGIRSREAFKVGETYSIDAYPAKDGSLIGLCATITFPDGKKLSIGASAAPTPAS